MGYVQINCTKVKIWLESSTANKEQQLLNQETLKPELFLYYIIERCEKACH